MLKTYNLDFLLSPKSITLIGASSNIRKVGGSILNNLLLAKYSGDILPVNPGRDEVQGVKSYKDIASLPEGIDLAIIAIGADHVFEVVVQLSQKSVKSMLILSSGFAEAGEHGVKLQSTLAGFAERVGIPICGPNSLGFYNFGESIVANFGQIFHKIDKVGPVSFITQSGAFGLYSAVFANEIGVGYNYFVSSGNEMMLDYFDYVEYFAMHKEVKVIGGYLEGARNFKKMDTALKACQENKKPVVLLKVGLSQLGAKAAVSHTASIVGDRDAYEGYFKQNNVIQVFDEEELVDTMALLDGVNRTKITPRNRRLGVVSFSGGAGILIADKCEEFGIEVAGLSRQTKEKLREILPGFSSVENPVDLTAQVVQDLGALENSLLTVLEDENVDTVIFYMQIGDFVWPDVVKVLTKVNQKTDKLLIASWVCPLDSAKNALIDNKICWIPTPSRAIRAIRNVYNFYSRHAELKASLHGGRLSKPVALPVNARVLDEVKSKEILKGYGINVPVGKPASSLGEAVEIAEEIGYPVVLKAISSEVVHKSDAGLVKLGLDDAAAVEKAYGEIVDGMGKFSSQAEGVLVEKMAEAGAEVIIGVSRDPLFGHCIMFGMGGIFVELFKEVAVRIPPISLHEAMNMIRETRCYPLLEGFRGGAAADIQALAETIVRVSELCVDQKDWLQELDINPLLVHEKGKGVIAVDALIVGENEGS